MSLRNERVRKALMREISDIIFREIKDPQICGMVSITDVDVSPDNSAARVFYSVYGNDEVKEKTSKALERHVGQIRHEVGKRIRLRKTPTLLFILDNSMERGAKMMELINKIERGEV
ncbi:MAG: 30S ribosome-binding factor RbfA [Candidatus Gastranaerophilales bacterium]|jgi:ribosome-binding factor A|nr:30S ribosome-binding factor RbfA [Candidatus Gastranaerophilales bacterium]